jgi:hypothetical protein
MLRAVTAGDTIAILTQNVAFGIGEQRAEWLIAGVERLLGKLNAAAEQTDVVLVHG